MTPGITSFSCVGGRDLTNCKNVLSSGVQIVIGTVGRTMHMLVGDGDGHGSYLSLSSLKAFALDEADQLLDGDFGRDLSTILSYFPEDSNSQVILMSATMPGHILKLAWRFMKNPVTFLVRDFQLTLDGIRQYHVKVEEEHKLETLIDLYHLIDKSRGMIFCNTRSKVIKVWKALNQQGFRLACIVS
jgi:superfamily II DNA/RNA helicase